MEINVEELSNIEEVELLTNSNYYWVRVYDYVAVRDTINKGTMLDEFYLKDVTGGREAVKKIVKDRYSSSTPLKFSFAKPKKETDGIYAIVMDSTRNFYDRFYVTIDTLCFWCHTPIKGKASEFPKVSIGKHAWFEHSEDMYNPDLAAYFCKHDCKARFSNSQRADSEGEYQLKEEGNNGNTFGYIYLIYNRTENLYYIGQTRYMPFFRWQEHIKEAKKGDINDLTFSVLAEIHKDTSKTEEENQQYLNSIEGWWIGKYKQEHYDVFNISKPKITLQHLKDRFNEMVIKQEQLILDL
jgi:hypothetical protein